ncbi:hypothetical protein Emag_002733 [Eimeria magna]
MVTRPLELQPRGELLDFTPSVSAAAVSVFLLDAPSDSHGDCSEKPGASSSGLMLHALPLETHASRAVVAAAVSAIAAAAAVVVHTS